MCTLCKNGTYSIAIHPNGRYSFSSQNILEEPIILTPNDISLSADKLVLDYKNNRYIFIPFKTFEWKLAVICPIEFADFKFVEYLGESVHIVCNKNSGMIVLYPSSSKSPLSIVSRKFEITKRNCFSIYTNNFVMKIEDGIISDLDFHNIGE